MDKIVNRAGKVSKTKLEEFCEKNNILKPNYETYGRKVCAYFFARGPNLVKTLKDIGCKIDITYYDGDASKGIEVTNISYFKTSPWK